MIFFRATDGYGVWYGSLDGLTRVLFPREPRAGDEEHIFANLDRKGNAAAVFPGWERKPPVRRAELEKRGFLFGTVITGVTSRRGQKTRASDLGERARQGPEAGIEFMSKSTGIPLDKIKEIVEWAMLVDSKQTGETTSKDDNPKEDEH